MSDLADVARSFEWINKEDGREAIDPVEEFKELEDRFVIHNGFYEYEVMKSDIKKWWFEDLPEENK